MSIVCALSVGTVGRHHQFRRRYPINIIIIDTNDGNFAKFFGEGFFSSFFYDIFLGSREKFAEIDPSSVSFIFIIYTIIFFF